MVVTNGKTCSFQPLRGNLHVTVAAHAISHMEKDDQQDGGYLVVLCGNNYFLSTAEFHAVRDWWQREES